MNISISDSIIQYWFADIDNGFDVESNNRLWYGSDTSVDQQIHSLYGEQVELALDGQLSDWLYSAKGTLAMILLLDQFTRNIFRGTSNAFAGDKRAREIVKASLTAGMDKQLTFIQRSFFYMPLEHSESLSDQRSCVQLFERLLDEVPEQGKKVITSSLRFAKHHCEIIERFGRFPHRNEVLSRTSTDQELDYLQSGGARFGQ